MQQPAQFANNLDLVRWNIIRKVKHSLPRNLNDLSLIFKNAFSNKLGCIKSIEYKLEIDDKVKPVYQPLRPIAIHLRDAVRIEIENQVNEGVLERVEPHHGPTPWVSNLVIVPKDRSVNSSTKLKEKQEDKPKLAVRLTCDSRALNKAIKRTRFPTKTVENIVHQVQGAKMFDIKHTRRSTSNKLSTNFS